SDFAVTGRCFGDKDFRGGLENGILLCELLSSIKPGLVKKINRLPTPIAGLDNLSVFLRGCEELGLKGSQLFDPGDLQDTSTVADCSRKLTNVLITIYWLGRAANSCTSYNGPTLDLKEFEGLLSQMRKEAEETESPQRSIRDSGYIDSWDSERSDSLSPPRHGREDSFDSLDSFGSRSRQTPSPDVLVTRRGSDSESDVGPHGGRKLPDVRKDDMLARRTSVSEPRVMVPFNQYLPNKSNASGYVPTPLRRKRGDRGGGGRKSWSTATSPIGSNRPFRSVSMIDMRCEEDASLPHHSQVRHELMHNQYNMMKEEEDHWQDDLARWKSRRRSVSQDLIKKEEERKMMEKLMTGEGGAISQRRKSIKTYREIVEEKERRENELREAYQSARTPEEAALVLHRYAQRFTISEAVLERLQLPKLLDRSVSEDPTTYLRQQSLPAPKFTATVEAQVAGFPQGQSHRPRIQSRTPEPNPSIQAASPKSVPLLTPKPYTQSKGTQMLAGPKPGKVDGLLRVNGNMGNDEVAAPESDGRTSPGRFYPSTATPTASSDPSDTPPCVATPPPTHSPSPRASPLTAMTTVAHGGTSAAVSPSSVPGEGDAQEKSNAQESIPPTSNGPYQVTQVSSPVVIQAKRGDRWAWDPDEERKRQERWQQEQERMLQEKYQREQEKLKQEWERAQREVEEEERRYHEEERRILEETVAPLTPLSCNLPSPIRGDAPAPMDPQDTIVRSLADWERKQELLERQGVRGDVMLGYLWNQANIFELAILFNSKYLQRGNVFFVTLDFKVIQLDTVQMCGSIETMGPSPLKSPTTCPSDMPPSPNRSVSGKKLCSSCGHPLGKGAAMIIETLSLYFHIQCFKCGVCKGQLGDTATGTDVRIRNGLLNCHQCYIRSRSAGQPTTL
uniref:LIM and calponin homology domains 1 n=1 Tax=Salmo trutta TaxID=8032 RepID=A0A673WPD4_SALTR